MQNIFPIIMESTGIAGIEVVSHSADHFLSWLEAQEKSTVWPVFTQAVTATKIRKSSPVSAREHDKVHGTDPDPLWGFRTRYSTLHTCHREWESVQSEQWLHSWGFSAYLFTNSSHQIKFYSQNQITANAHNVPVNMRTF